MPGRVKDILASVPGHIAGHRGLYSHVFPLPKDPENGSQMALKFVFTEISKELGGNMGAMMMYDIAESLSRGKKALTHTHISPTGFTTVTLHSRPTLALCGPWYAHGDILHYTSMLPALNRLVLTKQIASAIAHLHAHEVVHGNVYPGNILIDGNGKAILTDVGVYTAAQRHLSRLGLQTSSLYKPAEELSMEQVVNPTKAMDVCAFGCTVYAIFSGHEPFAGVRYTLENVISEICVHGHARLIKPLDMSDALWELAQYCWGKDPASRPSMEGVVVALEIMRSR